MKTDYCTIRMASTEIAECISHGDLPISICRSETVFLPNRVASIEEVIQSRVVYTYSSLCWRQHIPKMEQRHRGGICSVPSHQIDEVRHVVRCETTVLSGCQDVLYSTTGFIKADSVTVVILQRADSDSSLLVFGRTVCGHSAGSSVAKVLLGKRFWTTP